MDMLRKIPGLVVLLAVAGFCAGALEILQVYHQADGYQWAEWNVTADATGAASAVTGPMYGSLYTTYFESNDFDGEATATFLHASPFGTGRTYAFGTPWTITINTGELLVQRYNTGCEVASPIEIDLTGMGANATGKFMLVVSPDRAPQDVFDFGDFLAYFGG
jgi:hypothetical protein